MCVCAAAKLMASILEKRKLSVEKCMYLDKDENAYKPVSSVGARVAKR